MRTAEILTADCDTPKMNRAGSSRLAALMGRPAASCAGALTKQARLLTLTLGLFTQTRGQPLPPRASRVLPLPAGENVCRDLNHTGYGSSLNGLKTFSPGRLKSRSFPVAMVSPWRRAVAAM